MTTTIFDASMDTTNLTTIDDITTKADMKKTSSNLESTTAAISETTTTVDGTEPLLKSCPAFGSVTGKLFFYARFFYKV